jgi:hypothetical protein
MSLWLDDRVRQVGFVRTFAGPLVVTAGVIVAAAVTMANTWEETVGGLLFAAGLMVVGAALFRSGRRAHKHAVAEHEWFMRASKRADATDPG